MLRKLLVARPLIYLPSDTGFLLTPVYNQEDTVRSALLSTGIQL